MDPAELNYLETNRDSWNKRTEIHYSSAFYDLEGFIAGKSSLQDIELQLLGDIQNKSVLHLQCHFGQDTLSLARMGAEVTGVDFSDAAIKKATELAEIVQQKARFICADIYNLPAHLNEHFDIVFTSYGTIGWLPDLEKWAKIVSHFLKPGGSFVFAEFHPVVWMFDNNFTQIQYNYFKDNAIIETETGTYADKESEMERTDITWNHSLHEVLGSLLSEKLSLQTFQEFPYSPYNCLTGMQELSPGRFIIEKLGAIIPLVYALKMNKINA